MYCSDDDDNYSTSAYNSLHGYDSIASKCNDRDDKNVLATFGVFCENLHSSSVVLLVPVLHVLIGCDCALGGMLGVQCVVIINISISQVLAHIPKSFDFGSGFRTLVSY